MSATKLPLGPRHAFLSSMKALSGQFAAAKENVRAREGALMRALNQLDDSLKQTVGDIASNRLDQSNPLVLAARSADKKVAARLALWKKRVEQYDRNTEFREYIGDSLLVYVYGKVKAGKSSLGNYVAYGYGDPSPETLLAAKETGEQPTFFMRDTTESAEAEQKKVDILTRRKFSVGSMETTTEIQGFRLPGLTWIDSPGLHSVTPKNGELSKSYADAADLILYPMNSGQPGRASDLAEIAGLLRARKAFLVVITRCDEVDVDIDDDGNKVNVLCMKSPKDRQDQVDYVRQEVLAKAEQEARKLLDADVMTVSVSYAQKHADDPVLLGESGMTVLFQKLTALTQAQGVALKKAVPLNNLQAFVDVVLDGELSVKALRADLKILEENFVRQRASLAQKQQAVIGHVMLELDPAITQAVNQRRADRDVGALTKVCSKLVQDIVVRHATEALSEVLQDTQASINSAVKFDEFKDFPEFRDLVQEVKLSNKDKGRAVGRALGAVIAGIGVALAIPTGGASLEVASMAAVIAGAWVGEKAGGACAGDTTIFVSTGDNTLEVIAEAIRIASDAAQATVAAAFKKLDQDFLSPVEARSIAIIGALDSFETTLINEVRPNEI